MRRGEGLHSIRGVGKGRGMLHGKMIKYIIRKKEIEK